MASVSDSIALQLPSAEMKSYRSAPASPDHRPFHPTASAPAMTSRPRLPPFSGAEKRTLRLPTDIGAVIATQLLPFFDNKMVETILGFDAAVYAELGTAVS